jgi:thioredoxin-related protein
MTTKFFWIVSLIFISNAMIIGQGISFEKGSWADVTKKAKAENKYIFVDAFAEWCGPCKWMAKNVFPDTALGSYFNQNYVSYKFDMEKGEGKDFAKNFGVTAYPTLLFFSPDGALIHKAVGALTVEKLLEQSKNAFDPGKQVFSLKKKFESGENDPDFLYKYANSLIEANEDAKAVVDRYLKVIKKEDWALAKNFELIFYTHSDMKSEVYKYVAANKAVFEKVVGAEDVESFLKAALYRAMESVAESHDATAYNALKEETTKIFGADAVGLNARLDWLYNYGTADEFKFANIYFEKYCEDANMLNSVAWECFEKETDKKKLNAALKWVNKSISLTKNWYNLDTKANILKKLGKKKEAIATAEEAVQIAKANGEDPAETEKLIKELKGK